MADSEIDNAPIRRVVGAVKAKTSLGFGDGFMLGFGGVFGVFAAFLVMAVIGLMFESGFFVDLVRGIAKQLEEPDPVEAPVEPGTSSAEPPKSEPLKRTPEGRGEGVEPLFEGR